MDEEMKRFLQNQLKKEAQEIMKKVEEDPDVRNLKAPDYIHENLFAEIEKYKKQQEKEEDIMSEENQELIRLGKIYKKKKSRRKYVVLASATLVAMTVGVTSFGGAEKVMKEFHRMIGGREQLVVNSGDENIMTLEKNKEEEAYQKIKDEFGFEPVRMLYLPKNMNFQEATILKKLQSVQFIYEDENDTVLVFKINTNYITGSNSIDVDDKVVDSFFTETENIKIQIKEYVVPDAQYNKMSATFEYKNLQYFITGNDIKKQEFLKIIENLHFF